MIIITWDNFLLFNKYTLVVLIVIIPYSWKLSRDINFEVFKDFDISSEIKPLKFGFKIIIIGETACTLKFYSRSQKEVIKNFVPQKFPAMR